MTTYFTAFEENKIVARGDLQTMIDAQRDALSRSVNLFIYEDTTGLVRDVDLRDIPLPKRGRPKMGVKAREITLLPRHWDWLHTQKGGASAVLRRIVDSAMQASAGVRSDHERQTTTYSFIASIGGDLPGFEEATRKLFANDWRGFATLIATWPDDIRDYALMLAREQA